MSPFPNQIGRVAQTSFSPPFQGLWVVKISQGVGLGFNSSLLWSLGRDRCGTGWQIARLPVWATRPYGWGFDGKTTERPNSFCYIKKRGWCLQHQPLASWLTGVYSLITK